MYTEDTLFNGTKMCIRDRPTVLRRVAAAIFAGKGKDLYPEEPEDHLENFAENISKTVDAEEKERECH